MSDMIQTIKPKRNISEPGYLAGRAMEEVDLPHISGADADAEPREERLTFPEQQRTPPPPAQPAAEKPAVKFTVHAVLDDYPFEVEFAGSVDVLTATVKRLREIGAIPPTPAARQAVTEERERTAPVCPFHGPMKESTKAPGTWYCTKKMGDGSYCKEKS